MENTDNQYDSLFLKIQAYIKTTVELAKLKMIEKVIFIVTSMVSSLSVIFVFAAFFFVLTIGIALYLGEILGRSYYGFFIVAGFYLIIGIFLHFFLHKWIKKPVSELIINKALN